MFAMKLHVSVVLAQIHPSSRLIFSGGPDRFTGLLVISNTVKLRRRFAFQVIQSKFNLLIYLCLYFGLLHHFCLFL